MTPRSVRDSIRLRTATAVLTLGAFLAAQQDRGPTPIRSQGDDASLGAWAAGDDFKVGFVDGATTVVPYLGREAPHNLPWRWRTISATVGDRDLLGPSGTTEHRADLRYERRRGALLERWDVRADGVEQSFVVDRLPSRTADLVVSGRVDSTLRCEDRPPQAAPLRFVDPAGRAELHYGTALAFDAAGRTCAVPTAFAAGIIELRVPAAFVAAATLPLTIDPLVDVWVIGSGSLPSVAPGVLDVDVDRVSASDRMSLIRTEVRWASAADGDLFVTRSRDDFAVSQTIHTDLSTTESSYDASVAAVDMNRSFVVAWTRGVPGDTWIVWFVMPADAATPTVIRAASHPIEQREHSARLGGRKGLEGAGATALLVRLRDRRDGTGTTEVWASVLDATSAGSEGTPFRLAGSGQVLVADHAEPWVARDVYGAGAPWPVAWQTFAQLAGRWTVSVTQVRPDGSVAGTTFSPTLPSGSALHAMQPRVEGSFGRYLLAYTVADAVQYPGQISNPAGRSVRVQRFDWPTVGSVAPTAAWPPVTLASSTQRDLLLGGLAHDARTQSHWALAWHRYGHGQQVARLGYRGRILDFADLPEPATGSSVHTAAAVAHDRALERFPVHYAVRNTATNGQVSWLRYGGRVEHPALQPPTITGPACGPIAASQNRFRIGTEAPALVMIAGVAGRPALCVLSLTTANIPLSTFGINGGCALQVDPLAPNFILATPHVTDSRGDARLSFPLPEQTPPFDLYAQWLVQGVTPDELRASSGLRIEIR
ncbi:MAG: hypothetical protein IPM29_25575 [Planctomycetes bacterium]|nr:hypothetical protein [Planctomycetota bacterium]